MNVSRLPVSAKTARFHKRMEGIVNTAVRGADSLLGKLRLGGRKAAYDDVNYEFFGGEGSVLRKKHYDKSLRLLWKAEQKSPWLDFRDMTNDEKLLREMALRDLTDEEKRQRERMSSAEFRKFLDQNYTKNQKETLVRILSAIGHGEAYAWLVSNELLGQVQSTGGKAALTMQVLEEAKHFVVLRELLRAFEVPIPRLSVWEYLLLERVFKARGTEKFFGMNVVVEGIALSIFGLLCELPGLEILRMFHLDESRHTALPQNYLKAFPLSNWRSRNPFTRAERFNMIAPVIPLLFYMEADLAELGIDAFEFGGSIIRKVLHLAERAGFFLPMPADQFRKLFDLVFNGYCYATRPGHSYKHFSEAETTQGEHARTVEREVFGSSVKNEPISASNVSSTSNSASPAA